MVKPPVAPPAATPAADSAAALDEQILALMEQRARVAAAGLQKLREEYVKLMDRIQDAVGDYDLTAPQYLAMTSEQAQRYLVELSRTNRAAHGPTKRVAKVPPKYRSPENPELTWAGRGAQPIWVREHLAAGGSLESILIEPARAQAHLRKKGAAPGSGGKVSRKVPPKYRHPKNPELTWTGRGAQPLWIRDHLSKGKKLDSLLIDKQTAKK